MIHYRTFSSPTSARATAAQSAARARSGNQSLLTSQEQEFPKNPVKCPVPGRNHNYKTAGGRSVGPDRRAMTGPAGNRLVWFEQE